MLSLKLDKKTQIPWLGRVLSRGVYYWDQPFSVVWVGWFFSCSIRKKPVLVGLVDQLFQPALNLVEMVENDG